jgi:argonaute-like protein implicated in RNA metabolism and viral defense
LDKTVWISPGLTLSPELVKNQHFSWIENEDINFYRVSNFLQTFHFSAQSVSFREKAETSATEKMLQIVA